MQPIASGRRGLADCWNTPSRSSQEFLARVAALRAIFLGQKPKRSVEIVVSCSGYRRCHDLVLRCCFLRLVGALRLFVSFLFLHHSSSFELLSVSAVFPTLWCLSSYGLEKSSSSAHRRSRSFFSFSLHSGEYNEHALQACLHARCRDLSKTCGTVMPITKQRIFNSRLNLQRSIGAQTHKKLVQVC